MDEITKNSDLCDEHEAAKILGDLSVKTLRVWRCRKVGPKFYKIGSLVRYSKDSLRDYIESRCVNPKKLENQLAA